MKLKQKGTSVPTLEKAISMVDENVSELLIAQAFEVIFNEFKRYIKIMKMFKGVDWTIYVKQRNKERKNGDSKLEFFDEALLDEEEEPKKEEVKEEVKEEAKEEAKVEGEASNEEVKEEAKEEVKEEAKEGEEKKEEEKKEEE